MAINRQDRPGTIRLSAAVWLVASVLLLVAAASFLASFGTQQQDRVGIVSIASVTFALALLQVYLTLRLRQGKRSAREMLTTIAVLAGVPVLVRGIPGLWMIAVVMLLAVVPMWLPASNRFFQLCEPKVQRRRWPPRAAKR